jgi:hypothetical protein
MAYMNGETGITARDLEVYGGAVVQYRILCQESDSPHATAAKVALLAMEAAINAGSPLSPNHSNREVLYRALGLYQNGMHGVMREKQLEMIRRWGRYDPCMGPLIN